MLCVRRFGGLPVVVSALIALRFPRADNSRRFLALTRIETGRSAMVEVRVTAQVSLQVDEVGVESGDEVNPSRSNHLS